MGRLRHACPLCPAAVARNPTAMTIRTRYLTADRAGSSRPDQSSGSYNRARPMDEIICSLFIFRRYSNVAGRTRCTASPARGAPIPSPLLAAVCCPGRSAAGAAHAARRNLCHRFSGAVTASQKGEQMSSTPREQSEASSISLPGRPAGHHWIDEPQRQPLKALEVGQVFGVALDGDPSTSMSPQRPHSASSHARQQGMDARHVGTGRPRRRLPLTAGRPRPSVFHGLAWRHPNTAPALGNIACGRWNRQFFVSDLETGMIHRLRAGDGADLGAWTTAPRAAQLPRSRRQAEGVSRRSPRSIITCADERLTGGSCELAGIWIWRPPAAGCGGSGCRATPARRSPAFYSVWSTPADATRSGVRSRRRRNAIGLSVSWGRRRLRGDVRREFVCGFLPDAGDVARQATAIR